MRDAGCVLNALRSQTTAHRLKQSVDRYLVTNGTICVGRRRHELVATHPRTRPVWTASQPAVLDIQISGRLSRGVTFRELCMLDSGLLWIGGIKQNINLFRLNVSTCRNSECSFSPRGETGPALANRRPCSNCASESTSPHIPSPPSLLLPSLSLPLPSLPLSSLCHPLPEAKRTFKTSRGAGGSLYAPPAVSSIVCLQNASWLQHFSIFAHIFVRETNSISLNVINICVCAII